MALRCCVHRRTLLFISLLTVAALGLPLGPAQRLSGAKAAGATAGPIMVSQFVPCPNGSCKTLIPPP